MQIWALSEMSHRTASGAMSSLEGISLDFMSGIHTYRGRGRIRGGPADARGLRIRIRIPM